jgi:nicotinic acid mononucleotide adenylyltransferase/nicotinamide mononucleotide (NMN) deamidase PncC
LDSTLIKEIHDREGKFVFAITGGGVSALSELLSVPGASNTLLAAYVPYHSEELSRFIGGQPDQSCSRKTARSLAMAAFQRATKIDQEQTLYGLGCTAALATNRDRRGDDRCHIAIQSKTFTSEISVTFDKHQRTRAIEEQLCTSLLLDFVAGVLDIENNFGNQLHKTDKLTKHEVTATDSWQSLLEGTIQSTLTTAPPELIFPGAFNPLHKGHQEMIRYAEEFTGKAATLEISIFNVDKPPLDFIEMQQRQNALNSYSLIFTNAATFVEKCRIAPGATFIVGTDTLSRIVEPKYYNGSIDQRDLALDEIVALKTKFLVFGRHDDETFVSLVDLQLPPSLAGICTEVPRENFNVDVSSTEIRSTPLQSIDKQGVPNND